MTALILIALIAVPFALSYAIVRKWNMPNMFWRFGWSFFAFAFGLLVLYHSASVDWQNVKKGIDLNGGTILHYKNMTQDVDSNELAAALKKRIDPDGMANVTIRTLGVNKDQIEIIVPNTDESQVDMLKQRIGKIGSLEFRITANTYDNKDVIDAIQEGQNDVYLGKREGKPDAWWVPVQVGSEDNFVQKNEKTGELSGVGISNYVTRYIQSNYDEETKTVLDPKRPVIEVLVVADPYNVEGKYLSNAASGYDSNGKPIVQFSFNAEGARRMGHLTGDNCPTTNEQVAGQRITRQLGILLDGFIVSAPSIQSRISDNGQITGIKTIEEVNLLVDVLKAGRLPATLSPEPISEMSTGAQLGADTIQRAQYAMLISIALVMVLLLYYYRFSGLVAVISLILLVLLTWFLMNLVTMLLLTFGVSAELALYISLFVVIPLVFFCYFADITAIRHNLTMGQAVKDSARRVALGSFSITVFYLMNIAVIFFASFVLSMVMSFVGFEALLPLAEMTEEALLALTPEELVTLVMTPEIIQASFVSLAITAFIFVPFFVSYKTYFFKRMLSVYNGSAVQHTAEEDGEYDEKGRWFKYK